MTHSPVIGDNSQAADHAALRDGVRAVVTRFGDGYWLERDEDGHFPREFHRAMAEAGWLGITMPDAKEYHVERLLREVTVTRIAPITEQLILSYIAEKVLDLPRSY
jgi:alkylation response protein AidB-like acyl-CoA dehydrogenase